MKIKISVSAQSKEFAFPNTGTDDQVVAALNRAAKQFGVEFQLNGKKLKMLRGGIPKFSIAFDTSTGGRAMGCMKKATGALTQALNLKFVPTLGPKPTFHFEDVERHPMKIKISVSSSATEKKVLEKEIQALHSKISIAQKTYDLEGTGKSKRELEKLKTDLAYLNADFKKLGGIPPRLRDPRFAPKSRAGNGDR